jgi:hypothetical protein
VIDAPSAVQFGERGTITSGSGNLGTGLKYEFGYFGGFVDGIAVEAVYPTGSAAFNNKGLPSFNGSYQIGGPIIRNLGFNLTLGFNSFSSPPSPPALAGGKNPSATAFGPSLILADVAPPTFGLTSVTPGPADGKNVTATAFTPSLILGGVVFPQTKLNVEFANIRQAGRERADSIMETLFSNVNSRAFSWLTWKPHSA